MAVLLEIHKGSSHRGFLATTTLLIVLSVFAVVKDLGIVDTKGKQGRTQKEVKAGTYSGW